MEAQQLDQAEETKERKVSHIYGSFSIGDAEFAIAVEAIQEVVNAPESYTQMPLAPDYLLGLYHLRDMVIPTVDLSKIFNLKPVEELRENRKIVIVEYGDLCVGLLFDGTGDVFNAADQQLKLFEAEPQSKEDQMIKGVFKMDEGTRVVQVLDPLQVLNLDKIPRSPSRSSSLSSKAKKGERKQCISFLLNESLCALEINNIQEIVKIKKIDNSALAGDYCYGSINLRGNSIAVINFRKILGLKDASQEIDDVLSENSRVIVMKINGDLFGFLVDEIENIVPFYDQDLIEFPVLSHKKQEIFKGCITNDEFDKDIPEIILLDHELILSNDEILSITKGHRFLYKDNVASTEETKNKQISERKTYLTFSIQDFYALEIENVNEVINFPESVLHPPNIPKSYDGMINLRGEMVAIINPRSLYGMTEQDLDREKSKILIFSVSNSKYGLVVDEVSSIITVSEEEKAKLPKILYQNSGATFCGDVEEAIEITEGEEKRTLMILNLGSVCHRLGLNQEAS